MKPFPYYMSPLLPMLFSVLMLGATPAFADSGMPQSLSNSGAELILNGTGARKKAFITVYDAALYLPEKTQDAASVLASQAAVTMVLKIRSRLATGKRMAEAIRKGFSRSMGGDTAALQGEIDTLVSALQQSALAPGDEVMIENSGGSAPTTFSRNQELLQSTDGAVFRKALLGIWLSDDPVQASLKADLLGVD